MNTISFVRTKLSKAKKEQFLESIYYLKVDELKTISGELGATKKGAKADLIHAILLHLGISAAVKKPQSKKFAKYQGPLKPEKYILPGHYTNGAASREKLRRLIGEHFSFTTFGMDWIKAQWAESSYPTFQQFAKFWQAEFNRRQAGGSFQSAMTNARVRFFRENKGLSKSQLEKGWEKERKRHKSRILELLNDVLETKLETPRFKRKGL
ncbi:MAG: hypothetical protein AAF202_04635 [Pseudomonadota bacterium]